jgi:hypothetical protein
MTIIYLKILLFGKKPLDWTLGRRVNAVTLKGTLP